MSARTRVGLELVGSALRYAVLERDTSVWRLLRLGRCDFEFDAAAELVATDSDGRLTATAEAISEVLGGIEAVHFHLVVHPPACAAFSSPVASETPAPQRNEKLHWEAGQLTGLDEDEFKIIVHHLRTDRSPDDEAMDWYYVMAIRRSVYGNLIALLEHGRDRVVPHFSGSVHAASSVVRHTLKPEDGEGDEDGEGFLLVGQYGDRSEYTFVHGGTGAASCYWSSGHAEDAPYAAGRLLDSEEQTFEAVDDLLVYGPDPDEAALAHLAELTEQEPRRFNPFDALDIETGQVTDEFSYWEYVSSVGVTL